MSPTGNETAFGQSFDECIVFPYVRPTESRKHDGRGEKMRRAILAALLSALALVAFAMPAGATVHEITGMFCAGAHGNHFPAGLSGGSSADNFAQPLFAVGFIESVAPFAGDGANGSGVLITFDFDHPASKLAPHPTLETFFVGNATYISAFVFDSSHGFTNCVLLRSSG